MVFRFKHLVTVTIIIFLTSSHCLIEAWTLTLDILNVIYSLRKGVIVLRKAYFGSP